MYYLSTAIGLQRLLLLVGTIARFTTLQTRKYSSSLQCNSRTQQRISTMSLKLWHHSNEFPRAPTKMFIYSSSISDSSLAISAESFCNYKLWPTSLCFTSRVERYFLLSEHQRSEISCREEFSSVISNPLFL